MSDVHHFRSAAWSHLPTVFVLASVGMVVAVTSWSAGRNRWSLYLGLAWLAVVFCSLAWRLCTPSVSITSKSVTYRTAAFRRRAVHFADVERWTRLPSEFQLTDRRGCKAEVDLGELSDADRVTAAEELARRLAGQLQVRAGGPTSG